MLATGHLLARRPHHTAHGCYFSVKVLEDEEKDNIVTWKTSNL